MSDEEEEIGFLAVPPTQYKVKRGLTYYISLLLGALGALTGAAQVVFYLIQYTINEPDFYCYERSGRCWPLVTIYMISALVSWVIFMAMIPLLVIFVIRLSNPYNHRVPYLAAILFIDIYTFLTVLCTVFSWLIGYLIDHRPRIFTSVSAISGFILSTAITLSVVSVWRILRNMRCCRGK